LLNRSGNLSFTLASGVSRTAFNVIVVGIPRGLSFSASSRRLADGIRITGAGETPLRFRAAASAGKLKIALTTPATQAQVTIVTPAMSVTKSLATKLRQKKITSLPVSLELTDLSLTTTRRKLNLKAT
jgi:hypothetical protein